MNLVDILNKAIGKYNSGNFFDAENICIEILQNFPNDPETLYIQGASTQQLGNNEAAIELIGKAISFTPEKAYYHISLGQAYYEIHNWVKAISCFKKAIELKPNSGGAYNHLGSSYLALGKTDEAELSFKKTIEITPDLSFEHINLGSLYLTIGKLQDAFACFSKAVVLSPENPDIHRALGDIYTDFNEINSAIECYEHSISLNPENSKPYNNLALAYMKSGKRDKARDYFKKAIEIDPEYSGAYLNLSFIVDSDEKEECLQKLISLSPNNPYTLNRIAVSSIIKGDHDEGVSLYKRATLTKPVLEEAHSNLLFYMPHLPEVSCEHLYKEAICWGQEHSHKQEVFDYLNAPGLDRALRIGFVSADLNNHPVSSFLEGIFLKINPEKLQIFVYANFLKEDETTNRLKSNVPNWHSVKNMDDWQLAEQIRNDQIDILVDLSGHSRGNRLKMFSLKPAPVQATWLGFGGTTGVQSIDYILCDDIVIPQSDEPWYSEKVWRLPDCWICFTVPVEKVEIVDFPALNNGYVTFGSMNNITKITSSAISCWARILQQVPKSRMLIKNMKLEKQSAKDNLIKRFKDFGIEADRLTIKGWVKTKKENYKVHNEIDFILDSFPYTGGTTTIEALWMGVPVLTLNGSHFVGHMSSSFLKNLNLEEWITTSTDEYIKKAVYFAENYKKYSSLRSVLRKKLISSALCDERKFTQNLEEAFQGMWREWCGNRRH